jgi:hypothetical protein
MTEAMKAALRDVGCPSDIAQRLSSTMRVERPRGSTEWLLMLFNHGTCYPADRDNVPGAADHLALNVAADNAEAVDRTARGEPDWRPYWPLPDRAPRRQ